MRKFLKAVGAVSLIALTACSPSGEAPRTPQFTATDVTGADWGQQLSLRDPNGATHTLAEFKGKAVLVFFGYTQCPDICPTTLATAAAALRFLGPDAERVQVLFVTLDPLRDTPEVLSKYVPAFNPEFLALTGTQDEIAAAAKAFKVFYQVQPGSTPDTYTIDHTAASYAYDPEGRLRLYIKHGTTPEQLAGDLMLLLAK